MHIGPITLDAPFCQAGLAGYSDRAMRVTARRRGCPYAVTEALLDTILLQGGLGLKRSIDINDDDHPVAGQIIGSDPHTMAAAAKILHSFGYDVIDLNYACPVKKIKNKARGGHMLRDLERGSAILKAVRDTLPEATITVSTRRSFDDNEGSEALFHATVEACLENNIAALRVHGRTVEQKYAGKALWPAIADCKKRYPSLPLFGSGDVFTAGDAIRMLRETQCDGVWIARGAIGNPWIFQQSRTLLAGGEISPPTIFEQRDALSEHFAIAMQIHGEELAGRRMRKMGIKYARFHSHARAVKDGFIGVRSLREWTNVLDRFYTVDGPGVWSRENEEDEVNDCAIATPV